jgi:hypothetical protein
MAGHQHLHRVAPQLGHDGVELFEEICADDLGSYGAGDCLANDRRAGLTEGCRITWQPHTGYPVPELRREAGLPG